MSLSSQSKSIILLSGRASHTTLSSRSASGDDEPAHLEYVTSFELRQLYIREAVRAPVQLDHSFSIHGYLFGLIWAIYRLKFSTVYRNSMSMAIMRPTTMKTRQIQSI